MSSPAVKRMPSDGPQLCTTSAEPWGGSQNAQPIQPQPPTGQAETEKATERAAESEKAEETPQKAVASPPLPHLVNPPQTAEASNEAAKQSPQAAVQQQPSLSSEAAIERVEGFLRRLAVEHDKEGFFQEKVSSDLRGCEDYYDRIQKPMWFSRIREKLRAREYKTLHQFQLDVELICSNATTFNQKSSRVYKNAQNMLKGCRKQLLIERGMLAEAIHALHPDGVQAALAAEAEEEKALKAALPPKKPPAKPSKVAKPPKKSAGSAAAGNGLLRMTSSPQLLTPLTSLAPGADFTHLLGGPSDNDDLLVDVHAGEDFGYSSFSDTEDERQETQVLSRLGAVVERQDWGGAPGPSGEGTQSAAASSAQSNAWRLRRRAVEWRIRWLEHRLREIRHQQQRYITHLDGSQSKRVTAGKPVDVAMPDASAQIARQEQQLGSAEAAQPQAPGTLPWTGAQGDDAKIPALEGSESNLGLQKAGRISGLKKHRRHRRIAREDPLLDHPFFAAQAGLRRNKQIVRDTDETLAMEENEDFPARAYAALELLERQMHGLRRQLCEPGTGPAAQRRGLIASAGSRGVVKGPGLKVSQGFSGGPPPREGKPSKRRRTGEGSGSDFVLPGAGGSQSVVRLRASKITVPHFYEHSAEELRGRAIIARRLEAREAARRQAEATGDAKPEPSSSEEETDDEIFTRLHNVMQEQERAMYAGWTGGAQKKKKKNKSKDGKDEGGAVSMEIDVQSKAAAAALASPSAAGMPGGRQPALPSKTIQLNGIAMDAQNGAALAQSGVVLAADAGAEAPIDGDGDAGRTVALGRRGRPPGGFRGRGRARARGRPPSSGRSAVIVRPTRLAGPGRGHKVSRPEAQEATKGAFGATTIVASAVPPHVAADRPALSGGAADSELTDPQGGIEVPISLAQEQVVQQPKEPHHAADSAPRASDSPRAAQAKG